MAVHETPHLKEFMNGLYDCRYAEFYKEFPGVLDQVRASATHIGFCFGFRSGFLGSWVL